MSLQPLIELTEDVKILEDKAKNLYLRGISIQAEIVNQNKRKYPLSVIKEALTNYRDKLENGRAMGELDHPSENVHKVNPDRISHLFTKFELSGNNVITTAKILDTTCGKQVKNLIEGGCKLGMSSRGFGKTRNENGIAIVENLHFVTMADIVIDPSAPDAWQQAIYENKEWIFENGEIVGKDVQPIMEKVKVTLAKPMNRFTREKITERLFKKYIQSIGF